MINRNQGSDSIKKVKVGIVGLGAIAQKMHIPIISTLEETTITSVAEIDKERGSITAEKLGISNYYQYYEEMYENSELDAVFICLPNFLHFESVKKALENDINVFCEKPMSLNAKNARELAEIANKRELILAVGYNRRLSDNYQNLFKCVNSHKLGKILQFNGTMVNAGPYGGWIPSSDWFFKDRYGVLYDSGPHLIDLIMFLLSDEIKEVSAQGMSTMHGIDTLDSISGCLKTNKGIIGTFNMGWQAGANYDSIQIHGTGGTFIGDPFEIEFFHAGYGPLEKMEHHLKSTKNLFGTYINKAVSTNTSDTYLMEDKKFIDSVLGHGKPYVSGEHGAKVIAVLEAIKDSLDNKNLVKVDYD